jgi:hypothetical protein
MTRERRWDPCIAHRGDEVDAFIAEYFGSGERRVLFMGGAGFDPRSTAVASRLAATCARIRAVFFQENRPGPVRGLIDRATTNAAALTAAITDHEVMQLQIFGPDGAVIGGRNVVSALSRQPFDGLTDVVIDTSALSVGTSFPIIRYLVERIERGPGPANLHVFVAHDPTLDAAIQSIPSDSPGYVHGFRGRSTLDESAAAAKLWLPQLAAGRRGALGRLHDFVNPHDTCPILPFPASNPRLGDELAEEFLTELESGWSVDTRNIVYAAEEDPLDLYRTILRLDDLRKPVFQEVGGSLLVLSPAGSKVMALGALMAALERDLPVAHLESIGYDLDESVSMTSSTLNLVHVWLEGDVYPQPRPALQSEGTTAK